MKKIFLLVLFFVFLPVLVGCGQQPSVGLFSWHSSEVEDYHSLLRVTEKAKVNQIYQAFSQDSDPNATLQFLTAAGNAGISVYYLTGAPEWGLDPQGTSLIEAIEEAAILKDESSSLKGVVLDVEPYVSDEWEDDPSQVMEDYVKAMSAGYEAAKKENLQCIICIPWFYDHKGFTAELRYLIANCCDAVAVMNYLKSDEIGQISFEASVAQENGKEIINIYELQPPGNHDLTEENTYYNQGLEGVKNSEEKLLAKFTSISFAYHDFRALEGLLQNE